MRVHRARPGSGLVFAFSILFFACGTVTTPGEQQGSAGPAGSAGSKEDSGENAAAPNPEEAARRQQLAVSAAASLPNGGGADRTLSPYFFVDGDDSSGALLPLKSTQAEVYVAGALAEVHVAQTYKNQGTQKLEAVYLFPASTRAAVRSMKMTVGARVIEAQIRERGAARREYQQARAQGRTASLLEQQRPNIFQMNVANILPGDEIRVELCYVELLVPDKHVYEFVYPTTVGPRYAKKPPLPESTGEAAPQPPALPPASSAAPSFGLHAALQSGIPIQSVETPSHSAARLLKEQPTTAEVTLPPSSEAGNRDFILRYALEGNRIESGLLLDPGGPGEGENHFLLMMEPPRRIEPQAIVPREYIFIVDVSGSMHGFPLEVSKQLMRRLFTGLRPADSFNILSFSGGSALLSPVSLAATPENVKQALRYTNSWVSGDGTELLPALQRALALPRTAGVSRTVVVITDGYVDVEKEAFSLIRSSLGSANLFAFGIGSSVNRFLIEGMARAGQGEPFVVVNPSDAMEKAALFQSYISAPVLQGIQARLAGFDAYDLEPPALPDLFAERPIVLQGKYRGEARGKLIVQGHTAAGAFEQSLDVATAARCPKQGMLGVLWARARIARLSDGRGAQEEAEKKEITALGLQYHLMTSHTSFVAVDNVVRAAGQRGVTVQQPSVMAAGVQPASNSAGYGGGQHLSGVLGVTNSPASLSTIFGNSSALGRDAEDTLGGLIGTEVGDAYGAGGFGLVGSGRGGGGTGQGSIGLGVAALRTDVIPGSLTIRGPLSSELVLRILRRHRNELKFCYERELVRNSSLQGLITLQFVVQQSGQVVVSRVLSSTLQSPPVDQCFAAAVNRWEFPKPLGGLVVITAPLKLLQLNAKSATRTPASK